MVVLATAALATACTSSGTAPRAENAPWTLDGLAATPVDLPIQGSVDAPPAKGVAKILGIAEIAGTDVVLAVRNGTCQVSLLPDQLTEPASTAPATIGSQRPAAVAGAFSDAHQEFPGSVLAGKYTQASGQISPFKFTTVGCSEKAMVARIEGVDGTVEIRKKAGDSLKSWREGQDAVLAVGASEAIRQPAPASDTSS
ncbi:hypothetical protein ACFWA9_04355 [Kitasatospora sp. NPDC059973]|uniref:hypothetical protein n=1 Tax=Kitasatospora sp. NPDC059973 TaxID=3347020 RepID=UPI0036A37786